MRRPHQRRAPHQRPDSRSRGATCRSQRRAGRHRAACQGPWSLRRSTTSTWSRSRRRPRPPVCKLMDYGKFKYESAMKAREARKNQAHTVIKEMKLRPKIDPHDYDTKKGHVVRFLKQGDKVKITIMFRGREQSRPELGLPAAAAARGGRRGPRLHRVEPEAGRPKHDHGSRSAQEEDRGDGRGPGRRQGRAARRCRAARRGRSPRAARPPRTHAAEAEDPEAVRRRTPAEA